LNIIFLTEELFIRCVVVKDECGLLILPNFKFHFEKPEYSQTRRDREKNLCSVLNLFKIIRENFLLELDGSSFGNDICGEVEN